MHWVGRFSWISCNAFALCYFGFGGWVGGLWFDSCTSSSCGLLGWVSFSFACCIGGYLRVYIRFYLDMLKFS